MNHKRQLYDEAGQRIYLRKELETIFGHRAHATQLKDCIIVEHGSRYDPTNFRFACTLPLHVLHDGELRNPIMFVPDDLIESLLGVEFGADTSIESMLGRFDPENRFFIPVDTPNTVWHASHVLIRIHWRNADTTHNGIYAKSHGAIEFCSMANNKGRSGYDYWIVPTSRLELTTKATDMLAFFSLHATRITASYYGRSKRKSG